MGRGRRSHQVGVDLARGRGSVERVEVQPRRPGSKKFLAEPGRNLDSDGAHSHRIVGHGLESRDEGSRQCRAGELGKALKLAHVGHRHDPGNHGKVASTSGKIIDQPNPLRGVEEELGDRKSRTELPLAHQHINIAGAVSLARRMAIRESRYADGEVCEFGQQPDQFICVIQPIRGLHPWSCWTTLWITTQRQHVVDPSINITSDHLSNLFASGTDTGEMGDSGQVGMSGDLPGDAHRAVPCGSPRSIGHRHEGRAQGFQCPKGGPQSLLPRLVSRREELEGVRALTSLQQRVQCRRPGHGATLVKRRYGCRVGHPVDHADLRARVDRALSEFLAEQARTLELLGDELTPVINTAQSFLLEGGKRLRPAFAYWGFRGAGGKDSEETLHAVASLELLHACALIHDDLMDGSDTRRGLPSVHRLFAGMHREEKWVGDPEAFGLSAAILLGDLCLVWADQMFHRSGVTVEAMQIAQTLHDEMRVELMAGQYLDVLEQSLATQSVDRSMRVARYKSGKYTVERPLHFGARLAGCGAAELAQVTAAYSAYGLPLGEAFQLRDDILGVFGDPSQTGKPAGDDLREGKRTVLIAATLDRADNVQTHQMRRLLGDPGLDTQGVETLREIILQTGALAHVENLIDSLMTQSLDALRAAPIEEEARHVLHDLAVAATRRSL